MGMTEEEIKDMEARAAWENAQRAVAARLAAESPPEPTHSVDVKSLPDAPPEEPPPPAGPTMVDRANDLGRSIEGAKKKVAVGALRGADAVGMGAGLAGRAADYLDPPPNTEDTGEGLSREELARRERVASERSGEPPAHGGNVPPPGPEGSGERESMVSGASGGGGGGAGGIIPGGMGPYTEKRDVHYGKQVAPGVRDAYGAAGDLDMEAARRGRDADAGLYAHERDAALAKVAAGNTAAAAQQRINEESERITSDKLARIEVLNREAQGKPDDIWSAPHVLGRLSGFLMLTLGTVTMATGGSPAAGIALAMGGKFVNGLINEDISNKLQERGEAAKAAGRETNLLHLHEENLKSKSKAVEATKLAYYDNVLQQMDRYKADHRGEMNEANYENLQGQILKERAATANRLGMQEQADVKDEVVNKYRPPVATGAGGGASGQPGFMVKTPDGTWHSMPNEKTQNEAIATIQEKQGLIRINNDIANLRRRVKELKPSDYTDRQIYMARLEELEQTKLKKIETAEKQGVLREGEYSRAQALTGYATHGLSAPERLASGVPIVGKVGDARMAAGDAVIAAQTERWNRDMNEIPAGASAAIAERKYMRNPQTGDLEQRANYTGQDRRPTPGVAPHGSRSRDGSPLPTADLPASETTPDAPMRPYSLPAPAAHHGKKKKKE